MWRRFLVGVFVAAIQSIARGEWGSKQRKGRLARGIIHSGYCFRSVRVSNRLSLSLLR